MMLIDPQNRVENNHVDIICNLGRFYYTINTRECSHFHSSTYYIISSETLATISLNIGRQQVKFSLKKCKTKTV